MISCDFHHCKRADSFCSSDIFGMYSSFYYQCFSGKNLGLNAASYIFAVKESLCQQIQTTSFPSLNHQDCCFQSRSFSLQNRYASPILPTICSDRQGHSRAKALTLQGNGYCFPPSYDTSYRHWPWVFVSDQP